MLAAGRAFLATFGDEERAIRPELHRVWKLACLGGLGEEIAEHLIAIALAVTVCVHELPDAIAIEYEQFVPSCHDAHWLVEAGGEALPRYLFQIALEAGDQPHIAIKRNRSRLALIIQKGDVGEADIALPGIRNRKRDAVDNVGFAGCGEGGSGGDDGAPVTNSCGFGRLRRSETPAPLKVDTFFRCINGEN